MQLYILLNTNQFRLSHRPSALEMFQCFPRPTVAQNRYRLAAVYQGIYHLVSLHVAALCIKLVSGHTDQGQCTVQGDSLVKRSARFSFFIAN